MDKERLKNITTLLTGLKSYEWNELKRGVDMYFNRKAGRVEAADDFTESVFNDLKFGLFSDDLNKWWVNAVVLIVVLYIDVVISW